MDSEKIDHYIEKILEKILPQTFEFRPVTEPEIIKIVKSIKTNAMGIDNISALFIKVGIHIAVPFITDIVNNAITQRIFPCRWKLALIKPLPKVPHPVIPSDFRPICFLLLSLKSQKRYWPFKCKNISMKINYSTNFSQLTPKILVVQQF